MLCASGPAPQTEEEFLQLLCIGLGKRGDLVHVGCPFFCRVDGKIGVEFSCDIKFPTELLAELRGDEYTVLGVKGVHVRSNERHILPPFFGSVWILGVLEGFLMGFCPILIKNAPLCSTLCLLYYTFL